LRCWGVNYNAGYYEQTKGITRMLANNTPFPGLHVLRGGCGQYAIKNGTGTRQLRVCALLHLQTRMCSLQNGL